MQYVEGMYLFYYPDSLQYSCFYIVDTNSNFENFENRKKKKRTIFYSDAPYFYYALRIKLPQKSYVIHDWRYS